MEKPFQNDVKQKTGRKPYIKPQIETVPLLPRQTVLGSSCYSSSQPSGPTLAGCMANELSKCVL